MQGLRARHFPRPPLLDLGQLASNPAFESEAGTLSARNMDTPRRPTPAPTAHPHRHTPTKIAYRPSPHTMSAGRVRKKSEGLATPDRTPHDPCMAQGLVGTPSRLPAIGTLKSPRLPLSAAATSGQDADTTAVSTSGTAAGMQGVAARPEAAEEASTTPAAAGQEAGTAAEATMGARLVEASATEGTGQEAIPSLSAASEQAGTDESAQATAPSLEEAATEAPMLSLLQLGTGNPPDKRLPNHVPLDQLISDQHPASLASSPQHTGIPVASEPVWVDSPASQVPAKLMHADKLSPKSSNRAGLESSCSARSHNAPGIPAQANNPGTASAAQSSQLSSAGGVQQSTAMPVCCSSTGGPHQPTAQYTAGNHQESAPSSSHSRAGSRAASSPQADSKLHVALVAKSPAERQMSSPSPRVASAARSAGACKEASQSSSRPSGSITSSSKAVTPKLQRKRAISDQLPVDSTLASSGTVEAKQSGHRNPYSEAVSSEGAAASSQGRSEVGSKVMCNHEQPGCVLVGSRPPSAYR